MTTLDPHIDMNLDDQLRCGFAAWRARHFGMDALGDPSFVGSQMRGRSVRLRTLDRVRAGMGVAYERRRTPGHSRRDGGHDRHETFRRDDGARLIHRTGPD